MKNIKLFLYTFIYTTPLLANAQTMLFASTFKTIVYDAVAVFGILNPILFSIAFIVFFWGLTKFILHSGSPADIQKGKDYMFWGVIALVVLISFRTIAIWIGTDLGFGNVGTVPQFPTNLP